MVIKFPKKMSKDKKVTRDTQMLSSLLRHMINDKMYEQVLNDYDFEILVQALMISQELSDTRRKKENVS